MAPSAIGGMKGKYGGGGITKLGVAEAEIAKAQKALMATTEQMRQDAAGFMLVSDFGYQNPRTGGKAREKKARWLSDKRKDKGEDVIPDDFFTQMEDEVEDRITDLRLGAARPLQLGSTPRSVRSPRAARTPSPGRFQAAQTTENSWGTPRAAQTVGDAWAAQTVEMSDFIVSGSPPADMDVTVRPDATQTTVRFSTDEPSDAARLSDQTLGSAPTARPALTRSKTEGFLTTNTDGTPRTLANNAAFLERSADSIATLKTQLPVGLALSDGTCWASKLAAANDMTPWLEEATTRNALLTGSVADLMADFKAGVAVSKAEQEVLEDKIYDETRPDREEQALFYWEREITTEVEQEKHDMDQAIWRFRKYLRNRFGSALQAWQQLEQARQPIGNSVSSVSERARMDMTLSIQEIRVALSRLGIKLPSVTGCAKIKDLIGLIDRNSSKHLSFDELMGDEEADPSLKADEPDPERETWHTDIKQPRWGIDWQRGCFDKEMRERVISCDIRQFQSIYDNKPTRVRVKGEKPVWQKYQEVFDKQKSAKEEMVKAKEQKEIEECTFKPDMEYSRITGDRIMRSKAKRQATSQPAKSVHTRNYERHLKAREEMEKKCTFAPRICERSDCIFSNILDCGTSWWTRLASKERHDRMNHTTHLTAEAKEMLSFAPKIEKYGGLRRRDQPIFERLFHHEKHEFWHGDNRGLTADDLAHNSTMQSWADLNQENDHDIGNNDFMSKTEKEATRKIRAQMKASAQSASAGSRSPSPSKDGRDGPPKAKGEFTVPYRHQMLGMMEACERWGSRVDDKTMQQQMGRYEEPETQQTTPRGQSSSPSRSPSPQDPRRNRDLRRNHSAIFDNRMFDNNRGVMFDDKDAAMVSRGGLKGAATNQGADRRAKTPPPVPITVTPPAASNRRAKTPPPSRSRK